MLRNHSGWAWRRFVAFLFLVFLYSPTARGGPLIGTPPLKPVTITPPPSTYQAPSDYTLSGYVYVDSAGVGVKLPGEWGVTNVNLSLLEYSSTSSTTPIASFSATTNSAGYYTFSNLIPGDVYTLQETQPQAYYDTKNSVGIFLSATGGTLAAPAGSSNGTLAPPNGIDDIILPPPTGAFAPSSSGGVYAAANYNFGEFPQTPISGGTSSSSIGKPPLRPGVPSGGGSSPTLSASLSTSLAVVGYAYGADPRFLAGPTGAGTLDLAATVANSANPGSNSLGWTISSLSTGVSLTPTGATGVAAGQSSLLTGTVIGTNLSPGTQNATLTVTGSNTGGASLGTSSASVPIDPVLSRGIDSVTTANFGRILQGAVATTAVTVTSAGSHDKYSNLTMNGGAFANASDANGSYSVSNSAAMTFDGTTTTNPGVTVNGTFASVTGPISGTVAVPGNTGLFTGETLVSGTPILPTLNIPYSATVVQPRQLATATGGPATPFTVPTTGGGLLYGAYVYVPTSYAVTSTNANPSSNYTTSVYVSGGTAGAVSTVDGSSVGIVTPTQTLINSGGTITIPVTVEADALGPISGSASLSVVTAEAASVHDTTNYAPVGVAYKISNVGWAATGGVSPTNSNVQTFGAPLSAYFPAGAQISPSPGGASLTSIVGLAGSAGSNSVATGQGNNTLATVSGGTITQAQAMGTVGSEADILASTALSTSANITMAWRSRDNAENGSFLDPTWSTQLPAGIQWLASDVVNVQGVPTDLTFAMQMSYDDRINTALDNGATSQIAGSYLGKYVNGKWVNAVSADSGSPGAHAQTAVAGSLSNFLSTEFGLGYTLDQLVGSWGVDLTNEESWAIVNNGGGQFAVVPEPSTLLLLGVGVAGLLVCRVRRKLRAKSVAV